MQSQPVIEFVPFPEAPPVDGYISAPAETDTSRLRREAELERDCGNTMLLFSEEMQNAHVTVAEQLALKRSHLPKNALTVCTKFKQINLMLVVTQSRFVSEKKYTNRLCEATKTY